MKEQRTVGVTFLKYVSLNVSGMIGLSLYILADTFFVANGVGLNGLAALNLAIPVFSLNCATGLMCGMGGAIRYGILKGEGKREKASEIFTQTVFIGFFLSFLILTGGIFFAGDIASFLGADQSVYEMTRTYLVVIMCFAPLFCANYILVCFVRNDGAPGLSMISMAAGSLSNILFDYLFIYGMHMGMFGAALATGTSPAIGLLILLSRSVKGQNQFHFKWRKPSGKIICKLLKLGVSTFVNEISSGTVIFFLNAIILRIAGNTGVAAYGIVANIALVVIAVYTGIGQGIQPLISDYFGKRQKENMRKVFFMAVFTAWAVACLVYLIVLAGSKEMVSVFNSEENRQLAGMAQRGLLLYFTGFFFCGFNMVSIFYFSAASHSGTAFLVSIVRGLVSILAFAFLLSFFFGMEGVWLSFAAAELFTTGISIICYKRVPLS